MGVILPVCQATMQSLKSLHGWCTYTYAFVKGSEVRQIKL